MESGRPQMDSGAAQSSSFNVIFKDDHRQTVNELLVSNETISGAERSVSAILG